ncbi:MAG: tRNA-dependent cyclodipeptide synthase [Candidatus Woesearchaeota archaeon]
MRIVSTFGLGDLAVKNGKNYNCILGISVGSRDFSKEYIKKYLKWCFDTFDKTLIVIVDDIKKYNWIAFDNLSESDAQKKALYEGEEMTKAVKKVIKGLQQEKHDTTKVTLMRWNEIIKTIPEYDKTAKLLEKYLMKDKEFRHDAIIMADRYIQTRDLKEITPEQKDTAINFLIKELALFMLIGKSTKEQYCIDIYPGKFPVMENIFKSKYHNLLKELPKDIKYGHIEIAV